MAGNDVTSCKWRTLWKAVEENDLPTVREVFSDVEPDQRLVLLTKKNKCNDTVLHVSACSGHTDMFQFLTESVDVKDRLEVMQITCKCGSTPLQRAANNGHNDIIIFILGHFEKTIQTDMLLFKNRKGDTALHRAAWTGHDITIRLLIERLDINKRLELLKIQNKNGDTAVHDMAANSHLESLNYTLNSVNSLQRISILNIRNIENCTAFQLATIEGHINAMTCILESLTSTATRFTFLLLHRHREVTMSQTLQQCLQNIWKDQQKATRLLDIYYHKDASTMLKVMLDALYHIITAKAEDNLGITLLEGQQSESILHIASKLNHCHLIQKLIEISDEKSLNLTLTKKNKSGQTPFSLATCRQVRNLLAWAEAQEGFYYLKTPPKVVIMYSTIDREGADEECTCLIEALPEFSLEPIIVKDPTEEDIMNTVRLSQNRECAGLIVIMMSHGDRGSIYAKDKLVPITDIINQMNSPELNGKPKVLLLQACQSKKYAPHIFPNQDVRPPIGHPTMQRSLNHYDLPGHDFLVMAATINEGFATRNLMIPLLATNLEQSKSGDDMYDIFLRTKSQLIERQPGQVPEFRSTMNKKLCLRKIFQSTTKYRSLFSAKRNSSFKIFRK